MQVYKLEPKAYDHQVQQLVIQKQFELALQVAVSVSCSSRVLFLYQERLIVFLNDVAGADQRV